MTRLANYTSIDEHAVYRHILGLSLVIILFTLMFCTTKLVLAQETSHSASGWFAPRVVYHSDSAICDSSTQAEIEIRLVEYNSETPLTNPIGNWRVLIRDRSGSVITGQYLFAGETSSAGLCFDPSEHGIQVVVNDSAHYVRLETPAVYASDDLSSMHGFKFIGFAQLLSKSAAATQEPDIEAVFPSTHVISALPGFIARTNFLPDIYTAGQVNQMRFYVLDSNHNRLTAFDVTDGGTTGDRLVAPRAEDDVPTSDGHYYWLYHQNFDGTSDTSKPASPYSWEFSDLPSTGATLIAPYALDSTPPNLNSVSSFEIVERTLDSKLMVRVYLELADAISGLSTTTLTIRHLGLELATVEISHLDAPRARKLTLDVELDAASTFDFSLSSSDILGHTIVSESSYTTPSLSSLLIPTLNIQDADSLTSIRARLRATSTNPRGSVITQAGFCWSTSETDYVSELNFTAETFDPQALPNCIALPMYATTTFNYSTTTFEFSPSTTYYYRAFARNAAGYGFSNNGGGPASGIRSFTTTALAGDYTDGPPQVLARTPTSTTAVSTQLRGSLEHSGGDQVTRRAICYSLSLYGLPDDAPTISGGQCNVNNTAVSATTTLPLWFSYNVSSLQPNTPYFYRVYAVNSFGTGATTSQFTTDAAWYDFVAGSFVPDIVHDDMNMNYTIAVPVSIYDESNHFEVFERNVNYEVRLIDLLSNEVIFSHYNFSLGATSSLSTVVVNVDISDVPYGLYKLVLQVNVPPSPYFEADHRLPNNVKSYLVNLQDPDSIIDILSGEGGGAGTLLPDPGMQISLTDRVIRSGQSADIDWDTVYAFPMECVIEGPNTFGVNGRHEFDPAIHGALGTITSGPLFNAQNFRLTCTEPVTGSVFTNTTRINVAGTIIER
mgnify:CR=1 FL=1